MTYREKALELARAELGVKEHPAGSNSGPRVNQYLKSAGLGPGYPWCQAFLNWTFRQAGLDLEHVHEASVGFFLDWANRNGYVVNKPEPGDVVCYRFDSDTWPDHVGIVESVGPKRITAIEGNTAVGDDANGGMVMRRTRALSRCSFVRIPGDVPAVDHSKRLATLRAWILGQRKGGRSWASIKRTFNWKEYRNKGGR